MPAGGTHPQRNVASRPIASGEKHHSDPSGIVVRERTRTVRSRKGQALADQWDITIELDGPEWLIITADVDGIGPETLLRWFVEPDRLTRWWSQEATVEARPGGAWDIRWPAMSWTLRGRIAAIAPTSLLVSWSWDHEPDLPARALSVQAEATASGARLRIVQGPYLPGGVFPREDEDRAGHREGWAHFLPMLREAIARDVVSANRR
jgi:uncharacterized protein YndB with AHSA1/START domain